jgi:hypothetical protein
MKLTPKIIFPVLGGLFLLVAGLWFGTGGYDDWRQEQVIRSLIASGALREEVAQRLPLPFVDDSIGAQGRVGFEQWLAREPVTSFVGVRDRAAKYPGVWFHSTMWTMTWLFFDTDGRLKDYYLCAQ